MEDKQKGMKKKVKYFLNAIYYCIWRNYIKLGGIVGKNIDKILSPIPDYFFTKAYKKKYYEHLPNEKKKANFFFQNKKNGYYIGLANSLFGYLYSGYPCFISFVLVGFAIKKFNEYNHCLMVVLMAIPIGLAFIPAYISVFANDRYLKYFKQFEKEGKEWHRKWNRRTIAFFLGSLLAEILGVIAIFAINIL